MGRVSIPPPSAGRLRCDIELSADELSQTVELLRKTVAMLPGGTATAPAPAPAPVVNLAIAKGPSSYRPPTTSAPTTPVAAPAAAPVARPPQAYTPSTTSTSGSSYSAPPSSASTQAKWQGSAPAQPAAPARTAAPAPAARAAPAAALEWKRCWRTDEQEHSAQPITALLYRESFAGLFGDETHAGWLVSASSRILNLWECSRGAGRGEPALQIMHQQAIDYRPTSLDYDEKTQLLIAAAHDQRPNAQHTRVAALYAMDNEGLPLRFKAAVPMPEQKGGQPARERQPLPLIALSLSPLGDFLSKHLAMAHGREMAIADISVASKSGKTPMKAAWMSEHTVTCMATYPQHTALLSGTDAGEIHVWYLKNKPDKPVAKCCKPGARFTSLCNVKDNLFAAGALDGNVYLWDVRHADRLLGTFALGSAVAGLSAFRSPNNCASAASTVGGVQVGTVVGTDIPIWQRVAATAPPGGALPKGQTPGVMTWNERTQDLLYGAADGTVQVFREGTGPDV